MTERRHRVELAEKVRFLSDPAGYDDEPRRVEARETHMSWVFLTDTRVYKLKKPVRLSFLDFGTIARRRFFCEEELRLNRRLAARTYRQVVPLRRDKSGRLSLSGAGTTVDWLVEMERLPAADMLDECIRSGNANPHKLEKAATLLADFYAGREPEVADGGAYLHHLHAEQRINRSVLLRSEFGLADIASPALDAVDALLARSTSKIEARIACGGILEGHGDLRPEHVCLSEPPQIIDCLEFNRSMRILDPYDEVNYLGMECDLLGAGWVRPLLNRALESRLPDRPDASLLALYGGFRALLRARLCIAHLLETPVRHAGKWHPLAIRYLRQADQECLRPASRADRKSKRSNGAV